MSFLKSIVKKDRNERPQARREPEPSCFPQVVQKLRNVPTYAEINNQDIAELVTRLISPEKLIQYFDLVPEEEEADARVLLDCAPALGQPGEPHPPKQQYAANYTRIPAADDAEVDMLPAQLVLKWNQHQENPDDIESILLDEYGPLHAYLVVGNLILEWDWTSLIIPHGKPIKERPEAGVIQDVAEARCQPMKVALLKNEVLARAAKYNKMYYFHVIRRNSHDFVCDILKMMNSPPPQQLENKLKKYMDFLESSKSDGIPVEFQTHSILDQYVVGHMHNFSDIDKEYIILHYFMFHFVNRQRTGNQWRWECTEPDCKMAILKATIDTKQMKINNFRTMKYNFRPGSTSDDDSLHPLM